MGRRNSRRRRRRKIKSNYPIILSIVLICISLILLVLLKSLHIWTQYPVKKPTTVKKESPGSITKHKNSLTRHFAFIPSFKPEAKVAIIIDDMGYDDNIFHGFISLHVPLTFSILPEEPFSQKIAEEAYARNYEVMLHLPMESRNYTLNHIKGMIKMDMSSREMLAQLDKDIRAVPYIKGINNHMGSLFTENREAMHIILKEVKKKHLFFLDSRTTSNSIAYTLARQMGIKTGKRDVFLDNVSDVGYIKGQIHRLIKIAKRQGIAIGIGHPKWETLYALQESLPLFRREKIRLVFVSEVMK